MESHAKVAGHAAHQQLVFFPMGLLITATVFDILWKITGTEGFTVASYYMIAAGVLTGVAASISGTIDYIAIPVATRAKRIAAAHGIGNVVLLGMYAISWILRIDEGAHAPTLTAFLLALAGMLTAGLTGWLGGELIDRLGVGVDPEAGLDTPASFKTGVKIGRSTDSVRPY